MPWLTAASASGCSKICSSPWVCVSMKPGARARPWASMTDLARQRREPLGGEGDGDDPIAGDAQRYPGGPGAPLPSRTRAWVISVPEAPPAAAAPRGAARATKRQSTGVRRIAPIARRSLSTPPCTLCRRPAGRSGGKPGIHRAVRFRRCAVPPFWPSRSSPSPPRSLPRSASACRWRRPAVTMLRQPLRAAHGGSAATTVRASDRRAAQRPVRPATPAAAGCIRLRRSFARRPPKRSRRRPCSPGSRFSSHRTPPGPFAMTGGRPRRCGRAPLRPPHRAPPGRPRRRPEGPVLRLELQP